MLLDTLEDRMTNSPDEAGLLIIVAPPSSRSLQPIRRILPAWAVSAIAHAVLISMIAILRVPGSTRQMARIIQLIPDRPQEKVVIQPFDFRAFDVGEEAMGGALSELVTLPQPAVAVSVERPPWEWPSALSPVGRESQVSLTAATGEDFFRRYKTKGLAGVGTSSAAPAIDRLTREILVFLEERPTLVVWILDQSASLIPQRAEIQRRFDRIYRELGAIQASGDTDKHHDQPLLSSLISFGSEINLCLAKPTSDPTALREAVSQVSRDDSGTERVFAAILFAADKFRNFRRARRGTSEPIRNVMFVVMTDEAGDDEALVEQAVEVCNKVAIPVYVLGVPAPFGQTETLVKWIDPDPDYDQSPTWGRVHQGPETAAAERIRIGSTLDPEHQVPIDSGFGPFALTRLAYETGGIYFAVHADRDRVRTAGRHQVQSFSSHLKTFFDAEVMSRYQPDYVSAIAYQKIMQGNGARRALVTAAANSWISPLEDPQVQFLVRSEAQFAADLTEAQKKAAVRTPRIAELYRTLSQGEAARPRETEPRWQAGFDLAMGQVLSEFVRNETYNSMLAKAKRGMPFTDPQHNTWTLHATTDVDADSELQRLSHKAEEYLQRVCEDHAGTPWSFLAAQQRQEPWGWAWRESYTVLPEERAHEGGQTPPTNAA